MLTSTSLSQPFDMAQSTGMFLHEVFFSKHPVSNSQLGIRD